MYNDDKMLSFKLFINCTHCCDQLQVKMLDIMRRGYLGKTCKIV